MHCKKNESNFRLKPIPVIYQIMICVSVLFGQNKTAFVNPFIGTGGHGHTFPGAVLPFGLVQLSPDTRVDGSWDGCSGYHYDDKIIYGFSHTHLSGTGCSDWGDVLLMPMIGEASMDHKVYSSSFTHSNERASAGFYQVMLDKGNIQVELTSTLRVGIHRYTFPHQNEGHVILDLLHRDKTLDCNYRVVDSVTLVGYRISEAWAKEQQVYFAIRFSKPFRSESPAFGKKLVQKNAGETKLWEGAAFTFDTKDGKTIQIKVALSGVSEAGALNNMDTEAPHWDFEMYKRQAEKAWEAQLSKIQIKEKDLNKKTVFYTALYHCCIHPSLNMDVDGKYRGRDKQVHLAEGFVNYSVFSLWDTYRALHPLFTILEKERTADFINSFLNQYKQSGRLPMWELSANETDCMIGFHSVSVIADAYLKGIKGFDSSALYDAMKAASNYSAYGIPAFNQKGYLQVDDESESVSKSLEYAYDDWCIAQMAHALGKREEEQLYLDRSMAYLNVFDINSGNMRPRKNGNWIAPFFPTEINNHFTEGNSWHYSFYVPHDIEGLIKLHGGEANFETKLDELFTSTEKTRGREQADVTGLIGQYAHGNEPSHHMAYLYNYVGKPQKTIGYTRKICKEFYKNSPDGLIGNEDCGQMSAWYVFSAMGFYPVCPGSMDYVLGEPAFEEIIIFPTTSSAFKIKSEPYKNKNVAGISLNGKLSLQSYLTHAQVMQGGELQFKYQSGSENKYGKNKTERPRSLVTDVRVVAAPLIQSEKQVFKDKLLIGIESINSSNTELHYTLDGSDVNRNSKRYTKAFEIDSNCSVKAKAFASTSGISSSETFARYYKLRYNYEISIKSKANSQYMAEGGQTLIDGIRGDWDWRKGGWLGYQGQDLEVIVDLRSEKEISSLALGCLQDSRSWILYPTEIQFYGSSDNVTFRLLQTVVNKAPANEMSVQANTFTAFLKENTKTRYVKVLAKNYGKLPDWHQGAGGEAFIFVDELEIK